MFEEAPTKVCEIKLQCTEKIPVIHIYIIIDSQVLTTLSMILYI